MEKEKFEPPLAAALEPEPPRGVGGGMGGAAVASWSAPAWLQPQCQEGWRGVGGVSHPTSWALGMAAMLPGFLVFVFLTYNL